MRVANAQTNCTLARACSSASLPRALRPKLVRSTCHFLSGSRSVREEQNSNPILSHEHESFRFHACMCTTVSYSCLATSMHPLLAACLPAVACCTCLATSFRLLGLATLWCHKGVTGSPDKRAGITPSSVEESLHMQVMKCIKCIMGLHTCRGAEGRAVRCHACSAASAQRMGQAAKESGVRYLHGARHVGVRVTRRGGMEGRPGQECLPGNSKQTRPSLGEGRLCRRRHEHHV